MKLRIKKDYWTKKEGWQKTANKNLWIATITTLLLTTNYYFSQKYILTGITLSIFLIILIPQRIAYSRYNKEKLRKECGLPPKKKSKKEVKDTSYY